ncbi:MAG: MerR family transcriptional regulator [Deltaproteobacteria bacterium]|nr:MerR family transcriptional regulator [Deltaproteobacteria bacterium]
MRALLIGEVSRRAKLSPAALRYYESLGLIAASDRVGGKRVFATTVLERLALIRLAQHAGFTLAEIAELLRSRSKRRRGAGDFWKRAVARKQVSMLERAAQLDRTLRVLAALESCECTAPEQCAREFERLSPARH